MKFGAIPIEQSEGKLFAHNVAGADGRNAFRKGKTITAEDVRALAKLGHEKVYAAELEPGDVDENRAARWIAEAAVGGGLRIQGHTEGRANLAASAHGLLRVDEARLEQVNGCEGVAFSTLLSGSEVVAGQTVGVVKIIPYAIPEGPLKQIIRTAKGQTPLIEVKPFKPRQVSVVYAGSPAARERVVKSFGLALKRRVEALESRIDMETFVPLDGGNDEEALGAALRGQIAAGSDIILMASETSTMDVNDIIPCAVAGADGEIACLGAPVEPGNLVMLAYFGAVPLLNVPGCIRSPHPSQVDRILAALLAGERLGRAEIVRLGHGGLMEGMGHGL